MNIKHYKFLFAVSILTAMGSAFGCPLTISNDGKLNVLFMDYRNHQAVLIKSNGKKVIDPTVYGATKYFRKEKLTLCEETVKNSGDFICKYRLTERYCSDDPAQNQLSLTQIKSFIKQPNKRFHVKLLKRHRSFMKNNSRHHHQGHRH